MTSFLSLFSLAAMVAPASAALSPEAACEQLRAALSREHAVLTSVQDAASAAAALPELKAVLADMAAMDRSYDAEKALWQYIDNTPGAKMPLIELLQLISIEFTRLEKAHFYNNNSLRASLAPQLTAPAKSSH